MQVIVTAISSGSLSLFYQHREILHKTLFIFEKVVALIRKEIK